MKVITYVATLFLFSACITSKLHKQEDVICFRYDSNGKLTGKKFRQVVYAQGIAKLAIINREYDSSGRLISEYGFNHPKYGEKYMINMYYAGNRKTVENWFRWPGTNHDSSFTDFRRHFFRESALKPGEDGMENLYIQITAIEDSVLNGVFTQTPTDSQNKEKLQFRFHVEVDDIEFDHNGFLNLDKARRLQYP